MSKLNDFAKKNKVMLIMVGVLLFVLLLTTLVGSQGKQTDNTTLLNKQTSEIDMVSGDDTAESLNSLTEQLHAVISSNKKLQENNKALNQKNAKILKNIRKEVQHNLEKVLNERGQNNENKIAQLQGELTTVNQELKSQQMEKSGLSNSSNYPVDNPGESAQLSHYKSVHENGEDLIALPSVKGSVKADKIDSQNLENSELSNQYGSNASTPKKAKIIPYYTIPNGSTLAGSVTMSALIGRVPINGVVKSPYPFKMIIGGNNMAANGLHIPGLSGAIVQGYTVGDMELSCVKGYITSITFLFPNGSISTTKISSSNVSDLGFTNSLGYISEPNGNECFSGKFFSNAPEYLATMITLGGINKGGQAFQQSQMTSLSNASGGVTSSLTGSIGKAMLGGIAQGGTQQVMNWYTAREKNSFDAVYVPSGVHAVINITKQIDINYNPNGRKIDYEHAQETKSNTSLD